MEAPSQTTAEELESAEARVLAERLTNDQLRALIGLAPNPGAVSAAMAAVLAEREGQGRDASFRRGAGPIRLVDLSGPGLPKPAANPNSPRLGAI